MSENEWKLRPIGYLRSIYKDKFATPRQAGLVPHATGEIHLEPWVHPEASLKGLESFSHIWLVCGFHRNEQSRFLSRVHPPRLNGETMGVFATRSPHRPNGLGLSLVKLKEIENPVLRVEGVDLIDGTPIFDIKPYLVESENIADAKVGWLSQAATSSVAVRFTDKSLAQIAELPVPNFKDLIIETLSLDPRPVVYKKKTQNGAFRYSQVFAAHFFDYDVDFVFVNDQEIEVTNIREYRT